VQQLLFSVGPIALAIMGAYVSINPPARRGAWSAGFIVVGAISAFVIFQEVRGTDMAIDDMSGKIAALEKQTKRSPRLEFVGIETSTADDGNTLATSHFQTRAMLMRLLVVWLVPFFEGQLPRHKAI
jgi:hypothetical protein